MQPGENKVKGKISILTVLFVVALLLTACAGTSGQGAGASTEGTPAPVKIELTTNPSPPKSGNVEVIFKVTDSSGQPVTGADFDVIADHTDMRGMTMHGKASEQTAGQYAINADFSMSGKWKLTVQVQKENLNHKEEINLDIE